MSPKTTTASALLEEAAALEKKGNAAKAELIYRSILKQVPNQPHALLELSRLKFKQGALEESITLINKVIAARPDLAPLLTERGSRYSAANMLDKALADFERAITLDPKEAAAYHNMGSALRKNGRETEALAHFATADTLLPGNRSILLNIATTLHEVGRMDESLAAFDRLLAHFPNDAPARSNYGSALLSARRFADGWREYACRDSRDDVHIHFKHFPYPAWAGESIDGRDILVWTETGLGEEILAASMLPGAIAKARSVTVLCSDRILHLLRRSFPGALVEVRATSLPASVKARPIAFQMSMSELGQCLRRTVNDFPNRRKFLTPDPALTKSLRDKYRALAGGRRIVGLSWRSANPTKGKFKSTDLKDWKPILRTPVTQFVNLQYGDSHAEAEAANRDLSVSIFNDPDIDPLKDFDRAAAQVAAMDMVITVSNSTAHLSGGLGVPTWVMLPGAQGRFWYWQSEYHYSPWYPSVCLFRQATGDAWDPVIARCAAALRSMERRAS